MEIAKKLGSRVEERIAALSLPEGKAWVAGARQEALGRLESMGLPAKRDEYWKYTDPTALTAPEPPRAQVEAFDEAGIFDDADCLRICFTDGRFDESASDALELEGIEIERLETASQKDIHWARDLYGQIDARAHEPVERPLAALNTAYASDGILVRVTKTPSKPVALSYAHDDERSDAMLHHAIRVQAGQSLTLLESGPAASRFSNGVEIDLADGARFHHVRAQGRDHERRSVTGIFARLGEGSVFKSFTMTMNGVLTRNECVLELLGDDAAAHVAGVAVGQGADFLHDDTVFITHDAVNCESRQVFKKVLRDGATGVFQGKILVKAGAQKTDGYQISQSLLLDDDAQFYAKPELEIYADDVACSHGSTSGAIDETSLFYLRSRGVPEADAKNMLTLAFLAEALEEIEDDELAGRLRERLSQWLDRRAS